MLNRIGEFEKVSYGQFYEAIKEEFGEGFAEHPEIAFDDAVKFIYDKIQLPKRATSGSAGYDFKSPVRFTLQPNHTIKIPTGIRVKINEGWWLGVLPRSGLGFKYRLQLNNTMAVIDSDYYYSSNEGHIFVKITNDSKEGKVVDIKMGDGFAQGIFLPYGITYTDDADGVRNGGMGSTGG